MFLNQALAKALDMELMRVPGFSLDQLMELAGLSVACAIAEVFSRSAYSRILTVAGPGNNGGDALVAARHLKHFGYDRIQVLYPKPTMTPALFPGLIAQLKDLDVDVISALPDNFESRYDLIIDGVFGFSFDSKNGVRQPFDSILAALRNSNISIVSIDIPSAPKLCAKYFKGPHHYLGGRFLPPAMAVKYGLTDLPPFPGSSQCVRMPDSDASKSKKEKTEAACSGL